MRARMPFAEEAPLSVLRIVDEGVPEIVQGRELILTCGAIHSPAVLMRSGVGAPDELAKHNIPVAAALPGAIPEAERKAAAIGLQSSLMQEAFQRLRVAPRDL